MYLWTWKTKNNNTKTPFYLCLYTCKTCDVCCTYCFAGTACDRSLRTTVPSVQSFTLCRWFSLGETFKETNRPCSMSRGCFFFICTRHNQFNHGEDTLPKLCKLLDDDKKQIIMHVGLNIFYQWCYILFYFHHFRSHHALCCCACCCHVPPISRQTPTLRSIIRPCQLANVVRNNLYGVLR